MRLEELTRVDPGKKMVELLSKASNSLWMSSRLHPDFYNRPEIKQALEGAVEKVDEFRLLLDAQVNWSIRKIQLPWLDELIENGHITARKIEEPVLHWLIVDKKHFRLEKPHGIDETETSNLIVWDAIKPMSDMLRDRFNGWWNNASSLR